MAERNIRLLIEYDGTAYAGWQVQPVERTVQGIIREAAGRLADEDIDLQGSSRTDAGVHALGQVACFKTSCSLSKSDFSRGLNGLLPTDIVIKEVEEIPLEFDPRRDAKSKSYLYRILNQPLRAPLDRNRSWHITEPLDVAKMNEAAKHFLGKLDFASFRAAGSDASHSVREVLSFDVLQPTEKKAGLIEMRVTGKGFLRHMVRIMVGSLVKVGKGELTQADIENIIEAKDRSKAPATAPPQGLYLVEVKY